MDYGTAVAPFPPAVVVKDYRNYSGTDGAVILEVTGLRPGVYDFQGNYGLKVGAGITIYNRHADIGINQKSIDTAPAGGSTNATHIPQNGDDVNGTTTAELVGRRFIAVSGPSDIIYLRCIITLTAIDTLCKAMGALTWNRIADLP